MKIKGFRNKKLKLFLKKWHIRVKLCMVQYNRAFAALTVDPGLATITYMTIHNYM